MADFVSPNKFLRNKPNHFPRARLRGIQWQPAPAPAPATKPAPQASKPNAKSK